MLQAAEVMNAFLRGALTPPGRQQAARRAPLTHLDFLLAADTSAAAWPSASASAMAIAASARMRRAMVWGDERSGCAAGGVDVLLALLTKSLTARRERATA